MENTEKPNAIELALESIEGTAPEIAKELFIGDKEDIIFKTDLNNKEICSILKLQFADKILIDCGLGSLYSGIINDLKFSNVSLNRKSRKEFVDVNSRKMSNIQMPGEFDKIEESRK